MSEFIDKVAVLRQELRSKTLKRGRLISREDILPAPLAGEPDPLPLKIMEIDAQIRELEVNIRLLGG